MSKPPKKSMAYSESNDGAVNLKFLQQGQTRATEVNVVHAGAANKMGHKWL